MSQTPILLQPRAESRVRTYRAIFGAIDELRAAVAAKDKRVRKWKVWAFASIAALLVGGGGVFAIASSTTTFYGITGDVYVYDTTIFTLTSQGNQVAGATVAAAGTTNSLIGAVESASPNAAANTALTQGHWTYQITIAEAGANTFASVTGYYKVELFIDGTSQGAVYAKNAMLDVLNAEGVVVKFDMGTTLATSASYVIKVTQVAA